MNKLIITTTFEVVKIKKQSKSKYALWRDIRIGDKLEISIPIAYQRQYGGSVAKFKVLNQRTRHIMHVGMNSLEKYIENLELVAI